MKERRNIRVTIDDAIESFKIDNWHEDIISAILSTLESEGYIIVPKEYSDPIDKLRQISVIFNTEEQYDNNTSSTTHAADNLKGALLDLKRLGKPNEVITETLNRVANQLALIEQVLGDLTWPEGRQIMSINVSAEIVEAFTKDDDPNPNTEFSSDNKTYSMEWSFDNGQRLFIDIGADDGTIQIVWKNKTRFHQFSVNVKEDE